MPKLVSAERLTAGYGDSIVLEDVSFEVHAGEVLGIAGLIVLSLLLPSTGLVLLAPGKVAPEGTIQCSVFAVPSVPVRVSMRLGSIFCLASPPER